jgi:hypothetical protein
MNDNKRNEAKKHFSLKKYLFSVLSLPTTHLEDILSENEETLWQD